MISFDIYTLIVLLDTQECCFKFKNGIQKLKL